jgi:hypothetical protein
MKRTVLRVGDGSFDKGSTHRDAVLRSVLETTMEITSLIVFVAMVGVWALAFGVAG